MSKFQRKLAEKMGEDTMTISVKEYDKLTQFKNIALGHAHTYMGNLALNKPQNVQTYKNMQQLIDLDKL